MASIFETALASVKQRTRVKCSHAHGQKCDDKLRGLVPNASITTRNWHSNNGRGQCERRNGPPVLFWTTHLRIASRWGSACTLPVNCTAHGGAIRKVCRKCTNHPRQKRGCRCRTVTVPAITLDWVKPCTESCCVAVPREAGHSRWPGRAIAIDRSTRRTITLLSIVRSTWRSCKRRT